MKTSKPASSAATSKAPFDFTGPSLIGRGYDRVTPLQEPQSLRQIFIEKNMLQHLRTRFSTTGYEIQQPGNLIATHCGKLLS